VKRHIPFQNEELERPNNQSKKGLQHEPEALAGRKREEKKRESDRGHKGELEPFLEIPELTGGWRIGKERSTTLTVPHNLKPLVWK